MSKLIIALLVIISAIVYILPSAIDKHFVNIDSVVTNHKLMLDDTMNKEQ